MKRRGTKAWIEWRGTNFRSAMVVTRGEFFGGMKIRCEGVDIGCDFFFEVFVWYGACLRCMAKVHLYSVLVRRTRAWYGVI